MKQEPQEVDALAGYVQCSKMKSQSVAIKKSYSAIIVLFHGVAYYAVHVHGGFNF